MMETEDLSIPESVCLSVELRETAPAAPLAAPDDSVVKLLQVAADAIRELMAPCLTTHSLNDARFTIMRAIHCSPAGECSQSELARCLKQSEANVSTLLDRMRGDALVSREKSPLDRRRSIVRLTERGTALLCRAEQDYAYRSQEVLRSFAVYEVQSFREQLRQFIAVCETEMEHAFAGHAVAGRIGVVDSDIPTDSEGTETRHAQAG